MQQNRRIVYRNRQLFLREQTANEGISFDRYSHRI